MLAGEVRNKIDRVWDAFWSGGISNTLEVIEQITYLLFLRRLDMNQRREENKVRRKVEQALALDDELFASLQSRAFRGEC
ncbi:type I restriction-modification system subunit M N-terminal domain-containing protein [Bifidobacterium vansinderenii]|nr:type I restriction-modification system subunit M N-terminal domain-containing protein [Bifidobacterium vansinderenii]